MLLHYFLDLKYLHTKHIMKYSLLFIIILIFIFSCKKEPDYPNTPHIELEGVENNSSSNQSIFKFIIKFEDGNGDLGLKEQDTCRPYHNYNLHLDNGNTIAHNHKLCNNNTSYTGNFVRFGDHDSLPPYGSGDYLIMKAKNYMNSPSFPERTDTLKITLNKDHFNLMIDLLIKQEDGSYEKYEFPNQNFTIDGRYPYLNPDSNPQSLDGTLEYELTSFGIKTQLQGETIKFKISMKDRALNQSNWVTSRDIVIK